MSYCVNCGVELEDNIKACPLCSVEVINPAKKNEDEKARVLTYPNRIERINVKINKQFAAALVSVLMVLAAVICFVANLLIDNALTWSQYVIGAIFFAWVVVAGPLIFNRYIVLKSILLDIAALLLFLLMIERADNSRPWFAAVAVPLVGIVTILICLIMLGWQYRVLQRLSLAAAVFISIGIFILCLEVFLDLFLQKAVLLNWSPYAAIPCTFVALLLLIIQRKRRINQELKKRLHL